MEGVIMKSDTLGQRLIKGGEEELEEVIDLYGEKLLRYATAIVCDYYEAEDIIQEVFISAYKNRSKFDGRNLSAWLYKITYNRCLNNLKKRRLYYFREIHAQETIPEDEELSDEVLGALKRLKPKERALLYGRIMEEYSYAELSGIIGGSPSTLRKRYQRIKNKMVRYLNLEYKRKELKDEKIR